MHVNIRNKSILCHVTLDSPVTLVTTFLVLVPGILAKFPVAGMGLRVFMIRIL